MKKYEIFVATNGCDSNEGTINSPLATIDEAQRRVQKYRELGYAITVNIRGGNYYPDRSVCFSAKDGSLSPDNPIVYRAYKKEKVTFYGGRAIPADKISPVTDEAVLSRIIDKKARKKLVQVDLSDVFDSIMPLFNWVSDTKSHVPNRFYMNGKYMELARFPKRGNDPDKWGPYAMTLAYKHIGKARYHYMEKSLIERTKLWDKSTFDDLWAGGYFSHNWYNEYIKIDGVDYKKGALKSSARMVYEPKDGEFDADHYRRIYLYNILEELSKPGEYYIDYEKKVMYLVPSVSIDKLEIVIPTLGDTMFIFDLYCRNVVLSGINTAYTQGSVVTMNNCSNIVIENMEMAHGTQKAISARLSTHITVRGCHIHDFGNGAFMSEFCGETGPRNIANILIENCEIDHVSNISHCYTGVNFSYGTIGATVRNCKLHGSSHLLLSLGHTPEVLIENNEFYDSARDCDDSSVIYWGRTKVTLGITIRNNYFHDWGNEVATWGVACVYVDDGAIGPELYNNVFVNYMKDDWPEFTVLKASAESFSHVHNNIFITGSLYHRIGTWDNVHNCGIADSMPAMFGMYMNYNGHRWYDEMTSTGFYTQKWKNAYKGTNWERMYKYFTLENFAKIYKTKADALAEGCDEATANGRAVMTVDSIIWNHKLPDGTVYEGDIFDCIKEKFPDIYAAAMREVEGKSELEVSARLHLLTREMFYFARLVPEHTMDTHDNICIGILPMHVAENGKAKLGCYQAKTELIMKDATVNGVPMFKDERTFAMTDEAIAYVKERLPDFVPFELMLKK